MTGRRARVQGFVTPNLPTAIPAPAPYDSGPENRVATITTTASYVLLDLLLSQVFVGPEDATDSTLTAGTWQAFAAVGRVEVGRPILFRLATDLPLVTSPVTSIDWLGPRKHIDPRDIEAMKIIGNMLKQPKRPKHWWRRD